MDSRVSSVLRMRKLSNCVPQDLLGLGGLCGPPHKTWQGPPSTLPSARVLFVRVEDRLLNEHIYSSYCAPDTIVSALPLLIYFTVQVILYVSAAVSQIVDR